MTNKISFGTVDLSNGETLFYREAGEGDKVILLIHGNMSSSKHWEPILERIPQDYRVYAVDLRGMGESSYNTRINSLRELSEDIKLLLDQKNINSLVVAGWSMGGGVAMELACSYPKLVEKIILLNSASPMGYPIFKKDEKGQPLIGQFYSTKEEMAQDPVQVVPALAAIQSKNYGVMKYIWDLTIYVNNKPEEQEYKEYLDATFQQRNLVDIDWALATFNITNHHNGMTQGDGRVENIDMPVLCLWGDRDIVVPKIMVDQTLAAIGDNARLITLENCGHSPITDCPDILINHMMEFIKE